MSPDSYCARQIVDLWTVMSFHPEGRRAGEGMGKATVTVGRQSGGRPTVPVSLTREQRAQVETELRRGTVEKRVYLRARALLMMADGTPANRVAWELRIHERTAERWRERFRQGDPVAMLADAHRTGRPHSLSRKPTAHA